MSVLLEEHPALDGLIVLPSPTLGFYSGARYLATQFKALDITILVHLQPDRTVAFAGWLAGVQQRIGFAGERPRLLTHSLPYWKHLGEKHESRYAFELLQLIDVEEPENLNVDIYPSKSAGDTLPANLTGPADSPGLAIIHLGTDGRKAGLPMDLMLRSAHWLIEKYSWKIVLIGGEDETSAGEAFSRHIDGEVGAVHNLIGLLNLAQCAWLLKKARLFIGRDSGPAHLAAAMGCPTVTLFRSPRPVDRARRWSPLGPRTITLEKCKSAHWWENTEKISAQNLAAITFEEVKNAVETLLTR